MAETNIAWKECTQKIFWGVIVIAVAGIINVLYDYVSYGVSIFEFLAKYLPPNNNGLGVFFTSIHTLGFIAKAAIVVGYVLYLLGLTRFAAMQTNAVAAMNIQKVRTAVIILICCFAAGAIFGILFSIPFIGTVISLAVWIATLVAYFKMKNAFGVLMTSPAFSAASQKGAKKLRYAAVCNIRLMLMPIVVALIFGLLAFIAFAFLKGNSNPTWLLYVGGFVGVAAIICALVFMFFALVYPFIGWYQIMNGGPGEDSMTDGAEIEQRMASIPTTEEQMQAFKEKGEQAFASAKESLVPKLNQAKDWAVNNKKKLGIGVGAIALVALIAWIISLIGSGKGISFETYEIMDDPYQITIDIPQGNSEREQNVMKGLREIIAQSEMCKKDVIGAPIEGSIQEIIADCQKRYQKFAEDFCKESGAPAPPLCQLFIESGYQNEECVTFQVDDGVYFNGAPDTYFRIIRFSDGHVMEVGEMISITKEEVETIAKKYYKEEDGFAPVYVEDGFNILPAANDSCKITWVAGHGWGEVLVPLSEIESHLTDEGKKIFMAKPLDVPEKKGAKVAEQGEEQVTKDEQSQEEADGMDMEGYGSEGLLGSLPNGTTEYVGEMAGFPIEFTITKSEEGLRAKYKNVKFSATMQLEGESLPAQGGNISFYGDDSAGKKWFFELEGNADHITGTAQGDGKEFPVILNKK